MLACTEIIKTVDARDDLGWSVDEPGYMAATLEKVFFWWQNSRETETKTPFCCKALSEQWKEDGPQLMSMYMYSNSAITETEYGWLLIEWECLLGALNRGALD